MSGFETVAAQLLANVPHVPALSGASSRWYTRDDKSRPAPESVPSVGVNATDAVVYHAGGDVNATLGAVGAVVSFVIVTGEPLVAFRALSRAAIAWAAGDVTDPAVHEYLDDMYWGPAVIASAVCVQPAVATAG